MSGRLFHAPFIHTDPHFELYAVWERSKNLAEEKYPGIKTFRSLDAMLEDDAIELVIVNTPNYTHFDFARKALEAGRHVVVEKPFTLTSAEGNELITLAKSKGLLLTVYHNRRYDSDYLTIKEVLDKGMLGELVEAEINFARYKPAPGPKLHKETPGQGGGILYDLGSHIIDQALLLFGMPSQLFADIRMVRPGSQVDDYFEILFYYEKLRVRLKATQVARESTPGYILQGINGSFIKSKTNVQESDLDQGKLPGSPGWGTEPDDEKGFLHTDFEGKLIHEYIVSKKGNYGLYYDGVYEAIRNQKASPVDSAEAVKVIRVIEAAFESSEKKQVVSV